MPSGTSPTDPLRPSPHRPPDLPDLPAGVLAATPVDPFSTAAGWATRLAAAADDARQVALVLLAARDDCPLSGAAGAALTEVVRQVAGDVRGFSGSCTSTADDLRRVAARAVVSAPTSTTR